MMRDLAYANRAEIEAGKLAIGKTQNEQIKIFARKPVVEQHLTLAQELLGSTSSRKSDRSSCAADSPGYGRER